MIFHLGTVGGVALALAVVIGQAANAQSSIGLRAQAAALPGLERQEWAESSEYVVRLAGMRERFRQETYPVWMKDRFTLLQRARSYAGAKLWDLVPIAGSIVDDIDTVAWQAMEKMHEDEFIKWLKAETGFVYGNPDRLAERLGRGERFDRSAARAVVMHFIDVGNPSFGELTPARRDELQNRAILYLANVADRHEVILQATRTQVDGMSRQIENHSARLLRVERAIREYKQTIDRLQNDGTRARESLKGALSNQDVDAAAVKEREILDLYSRGMATMGKQATELAGALRAAGAPEPARAAGVIGSSLQLLAGGIAVSAGDPFAILPTLTAAANLFSSFGPSRPDPTAAALKRITDGIIEIDRKIVELHREVAARLGALGVAVGEVLHATSFLSQDDAVLCWDWLRNDADRALASLKSEVAVEGSVRDFAHFYALDVRAISNMFSNQRYAEGCLNGLPKVFTITGLAGFNPAIQMPLSRGDVPGLPAPQAAPPDPYQILAENWTKHRWYVGRALTKRGREEFLVPRASALADRSGLPERSDGGSALGATSGAFSGNAGEIFERAERLFHMPALVRYGSYVAAVHHFYSFSSTTGRAFTSTPRDNREGRYLTSQAQAVLEAALAQLHMLSSGPLLELAEVALFNQDEAFAKTPRCRMILVACKAPLENRQELLQLVKANPWLAYNLATRITARALRENGVGRSAYAFAFNYSKQTGDPLALTALFRGTPPTGATFDWNSENKQWTLKYGDVFLPLPDPSSMPDGSYIYPPVYYELVRVAARLAIESGTYRFDPKVERSFLTKALASRAFPP